MSWLVETIEAEIIPRLMAAHREEPVEQAESDHIRQQDIISFSDIVLWRDSAACLEFVASIRERGVSLRSIYLELIAPTASRLGALWHQDVCDFTQVTIGLWRMQQILYDLSPAFRTGHEDPASPHRRIMLTVVPGSQHTLGILMVAEFFRRAGWNVWGEPAASKEQLIEAVSRDRFDVIGISVGSEPQLVDLKAFVDELRSASRNQDIAIMLGGPVMAQHTQDFSDFGADAVSGDAEHAIRTAEQLVVDRKRSTQ